MLRISMVSDIRMQMVEISGMQMVETSPTLNQNFKISNQKYYKNLYTTYNSSGTICKSIFKTKITQGSPDNVPSDKKEQLKTSNFKKK